MAAETTETSKRVKIDEAGGYVTKNCARMVTNMDTLVAPLEEVEVFRVMELLGSTLRTATDKLKILDTVDEDQRYTIARAKTSMRWKAEAQLAANEVPEVAFLLKLVVAQQVAYEALGQRTEMVRHRLKDYQNYQKYCEEARVAVQTLERVQAALRGEATWNKKGPSDSFWQSL
jgi:hypothetical protein